MWAISFLNLVFNAILKSLLFEINSKETVIIMMMEMELIVLVLRAAIMYAVYRRHQLQIHLHTLFVDIMIISYTIKRFKTIHLISLYNVQ